MKLAAVAEKIRRSGRWMVLFSLSALALYFCLPSVYSLVHALFPTYFRGFAISELILPILAVPILLCAIIAGAGTILWVAGWITVRLGEGKHMITVP
jgi:hypothetical protein